jgi:dihydroneopterin aldolase
VQGTGCAVFVEELSVRVRVGIHDAEYLAPQVVLISSRIEYACAPDEASMIDYEKWCSTIEARLAAASHTRLLEDLLVIAAEITFELWSNISRLSVSAHKPNIRAGAGKVGVSLDWDKSQYESWKEKRENHSPNLIDGLVATERNLG